MICTSPWVLTDLPLFDQGIKDKGQSSGLRLDMAITYGGVCNSNVLCTHLPRDYCAKFTKKEKRR